MLAKYSTGMDWMVVEVLEEEAEGKHPSPPTTRARDPEGDDDRTYTYTLIRKIGGDNGTMQVKPEDVEPLDVDDPGDAPVTYLDRVDDRRPYDVDVVAFFEAEGVKTVGDLAHEDIGDFPDISAIKLAAERVASYNG